MLSKVTVFQVQLKRVGSFHFGYDHQSVTSPEVSEQIFREYMERYCSTDRENFLALYLNTQNKITGIETVHTGSLDASIVHPREVFTSAILHKASSLIVCHQHPSGDPRPSAEDIEMTKRLKDAGEVLGIFLLDHIVLGENTFRSLMRDGYL